MSERAPYSRVYWSIVDDPKFVEVYDNDRRLATWLRLLLIADQAHPASPHVPAGIHRASLKALSECGLIDLGAGNRYRVRGLDKERARRWGGRGGSEPGPTPDPNGTPKGPKPDPLAPSRAGDARDETRQAEPRKDETSNGLPQRLNTPRATSGEPLLTKVQLDAWRSFGSEWDAFKAAWLARGFLFPPFGSEEDDDSSQRGLLWSILDARPTDLVRWVREAPGVTPTEVIGHVIGNWRTIRDDADATSPAIVAQGPNRREALEVVGSVLARVTRAADVA